VCNQRDRFKARTIELESDNKHLHLRLDIKEKEILSLREDNIKLYEKIKYLQSYSSRGNKVHSNVLGLPLTTTQSTDIESNKLEDEVDTKYSKLYEDSVNPFVIFNRKVLILV
jgi:homeobox protein cut-like